MSFFKCSWAGLILLLCALSSQAYAERLDGIASVVNGDVITCYEVDKAITTLQTQLVQQGSVLPSHDDLYKRALDSRVMRLLQHQEASQAGVVISPEEVDAAMSDVEKRNKLEPGQLKEVLKAQGIDIKGYRTTLKDRLLSTRLMNLEVRSKISISEESMQEYYRKHLKNPKEVREVKASQLFVALPADADSKAVEMTRQKIQAFQRELQNGADFKRMVTLKSDAPDATSGGDMGWVSPGVVRGAFAQVFQLKVGEMTNIIRSAAGFHILKITGERMRKPRNTEAYEEVRARHILIKIPDSADFSTQLKIRTRAEKIAKEMQGTSDDAFVVRAKELSQGPSASRGGDLGWFKRGQMVKAFEDVVFDMKPGDTSGIVTTQFGLHIIRLVNKRKVNPNAFEARKEEIERQLIEAEMQQQVPRWMNGLKANAVIAAGDCGLVSNFEVENMPVPQKDVTKEDNMTSLEDKAKASLSAWEKAWERKDLDVYFASYDQRISPDKRFLTFKKWKQYKRRVINASAQIEVTVRNLQQEILEVGKSVRFTFDQHFKSNILNDDDQKIIVMNLIGDQWKIISETTVKNKQ